MDEKPGRTRSLQQTGAAIRFLWSFLSSERPLLRCRSGRSDGACPMFCFCCDRSFNWDVSNCQVEHCRRCLNCARHCPCPDPRLVGEDEADEPEVV
jgi:hypothetical protein